MYEVTVDTEIHNDGVYDEINASFGADALLYNALSDRLENSGISEGCLLEWARFVKLAPEAVVKINELEEFAVVKILRSWKSIEGILQLNKDTAVSSRA